jgi:hypothetical protein
LLAGVIRGHVRPHARSDPVAKIYRDALLSDDRTRTRAFAERVLMRQGRQGKHGLARNMRTNQSSKNCSEGWMHLAMYLKTPVR